MNEKQPERAGYLKGKSFAFGSVPLGPGRTRILFQPRRTTVNTVSSPMEIKKDMR